MKKGDFFWFFCVGLLSIVIYQTLVWARFPKPEAVAIPVVQPITVCNPDDIALFNDCGEKAAAIVIQLGYDPTYFDTRGLVIQIAVELFKAAKQGGGDL